MLHTSNYNITVATRNVQRRLTMNIGNKIKELRKQKGITQEKLAAYLNLSCQAVSKWENGAATPDLSLIVPIANFFGITTDSLLERNIEEQKEEIENFVKIGAELARQGLIEKQIEHWRAAVEKYPSNYNCLTHYASALFSAKFSYDFEGREQLADEYTDKCIEICKRILEDCTETGNRDSATQMLVMIYGNPGRKHYDEELAESYAKNASSIHCSYEFLMEAAFRIDSEKHLEQKHRNTLIFLDSITQSIALRKCASTEEKIFFLNTALSIWNSVIYDGNFLFFHCRIAQIYRFLSLSYANLGKTEEAISALEKAKYHSIKSDTLPDGKQYYTSVFVNKAWHDNAFTSKNFSCTELDILKSELKNHIYDPLRSTEEFKAFEKSIDVL